MSQRHTLIRTHTLTRSRQRPPQPPFHQPKNSFSLSLEHTHTPAHIHTHTDQRSYHNSFTRMDSSHISKNGCNQVSPPPPPPSPILLLSHLPTHLPNYMQLSPCVCVCGVCAPPGCIVEYIIIYIERPCTMATQFQKYTHIYHITSGKPTFRGSRICISKRSILLFIQEAHVLWPTNNLHIVMYITVHHGSPYAYMVCYGVYYNMYLGSPCTV